MTDRAEEEVPEHLWRLTMYYHDLMHVKWGYEAVGATPPKHVLTEIDRVHVRLETIVEREHQQGGAFHKQKKEMDDEARNRTLDTLRNEAGAGSSRNQSRGGFTNWEPRGEPRDGQGGTGK